MFTQGRGRGVGGQDPTEIYYAWFSVWLQNCTLSSIRRWVKGIFIAGSLSYEYVKEGLVKARATDMEDTIHSYGLARLTIYKQNYPSIG